MNTLAKRNVWTGAALALVAGIAIAPGAIALPEAGRAPSSSSILVAQALTSTTGTVIDTDAREDTVRLRLSDGSIRMFSLSSQEQSQLGLERGAEVMLTMSGNRIITMTRMISSSPEMSTTATVVDTDLREDTVRLRLANGSIRMFSLAAQKQGQLGLAPGVEVMLTMSGDRIITMMRMVSVQPAEQVEATVVELTPRLDRIRVRLADGSIRLLSLSVQDQARLGLRNGSAVTLTTRGNRIETMTSNNQVATVTDPGQS
ncbi:hypothetical protein [Leptolyngbya sp. O-77]|uniref:hypothetical protein n=1 Tax=Leptolyngbya sp. O-77 TaxID=1080068 RepID=UPI00074D2D5F|nr:hypothetical protein [Leptolyngbya sp. O-77]BAU43801.1 DNA-binding transcriptional regulator ModE [Leptolyngbya sp. O-77]